MTVEGQPTGKDGVPLYLYSQVQRWQDLQTPDDQRGRVETGSIQGRTAAGELLVLWPCGRELAHQPDELVRHDPHHGPGRGC